jgi:uncharacterized protein YfiM (DUF2279 family)
MFRRTKVITPALVVLLLFGATTASAKDNFFGKDKYYHGLGSMILAETGYVATVWAQGGDSSSSLPLMVGLATGMIPGITKELWDLTQPDHTFSFQDLAWDAMGTFTGLLIARSLHLLFNKK